MRKSLKLFMSAFTVCITLYMLSCTIHAATYYVSATTGNDSRTAAQAQSTSTPWKTISKAASVMVPGDTCSIMAGTYRETVTPANSGTSSAKITYTNYNNGKVVVNGTDLLTGWVQHSGSIFKATTSLNMGNGNQLFANGEMITEARWPNNTSAQLLQPTLAAADTATNTSISDAELNQANDFWNGATMWCLSGTGWIAQRVTITDFDAATHTLKFNSFVTDGGNKQHPDRHT